MISPDHRSVVRPVGMKPPGIVRQRTRQIMLHCFVNCMQVGKDRLDAGGEQMLLCTHSHPSRNENADPSERRRHGRVLLALMDTFMSPVAMLSLTPGMMAGFVNTVSFDDLPVLEPEDLIVERPSEVGTDCHAVISDKGNR
jgi:hypothetical protein